MAKYIITGLCFFHYTYTQRLNTPLKERAGCTLPRGLHAVHKYHVRNYIERAGWQRRWKYGTEVGTRCECNYLNIRRRRRVSSGNISQLAPYYASNLRPAIRARCFWEVETDEYLREEPTSADSSPPRLRLGHVVAFGRGVGEKSAVVGESYRAVVGQIVQGGGKRQVAVVPDIDVKVFHLGCTLFSRGSREINRIKSLPTGISPLPVSRRF